MTRKPPLAPEDDPPSLRSGEAGQTRRFAAYSDDTRRLTAEILTMREAFAVLRQAVERRAIDCEGLQKDKAADFMLEIDRLQKDLAAFLLVWSPKD